MPRPFLVSALTLAIGAAGGALAALFGLPAAWLVGATLAVTAAALGGVPIRLPPALRSLGFAVIGLSMGSRATGETLALAAQWPLSFVGLLLSIAATMALSILYLRRVHGQDMATAVLATSPGAMTVAAALLAAGHGNASQVVVIQSVRLLALVVAVPVAIGFAPGDPAGAAPPAALLATGPALALMIAMALASGAAFERLRVPAAFLVAGLATGLATHVTDLLPGAFPDWLLIPGFVVTGASIGARFQSISAAQIRDAARAALVVVVITTGISAGFALLFAALLGQPFGQVWIAYGPGAVEVMAAMALTFDYDATYVASHHILRIVLLGFGMAWFLSRMKGPAAPGE